MRQRQASQIIENQRIGEVAKILAKGFMRLTAKQHEVDKKSPKMIQTQGKAGKDSSNFQVSS